MLEVGISGGRAMHDPNEFTKNLSAWTYEQLVPFHDKAVAWAMDGKSILASADNYEALFERLDELGLKEYVIDYVSDPNISFLGGLLDASAEEQDDILSLICYSWSSG